MKRKDAVLTSVVSYPERGAGGNNKYRGNCSPKLIEDLINFFNPPEICDYMVGSGTTESAAAACGITSHCYDLNRGFDLLSCDIPERSPFTFWHPPYGGMILYSDNMYKASDIIQKYGFDPRPSDLSRMPWPQFVEAMNYCMMKQFAALEKGGSMAVLMGDWKQKGRLYSMLAEIAKPGILTNILIKTQHNCVSDRTSYSGRFIPIVHEYVMIVKKEDDLIFPVMLNHTHKVDVRDMKGSSWRDVVSAVMRQRKGIWTLDDIYSDISGHQKAKQNPHWQAKVRQTLQMHPSLFRHESRGQWSLVAA